MSDPMTQTGITNLLSLMSAGGMTPGMQGAQPGASGAGFAAFLQQGMPALGQFFDENGQLLPQAGEGLPAELMAELAKQLEAQQQGHTAEEGIAPELSQLLEQLVPEATLQPGLRDGEQLREGVVVREEWGGLLQDSSTSVPTDVPVVALMQEVADNALKASGESVATDAGMSPAGMSATAQVGGALTQSQPQTGAGLSVPAPILPGQARSDATAANPALVNASKVGEHSQTLARSQLLSTDSQAASAKPVPESAEMSRLAAAISGAQAVASGAANRQGDSAASSRSADAATGVLQELVSGKTSEASANRTAGAVHAAQAQQSQPVTQPVTPVPATPVQPQILAESSAQLADNVSVEDAAELGRSQSEKAVADPLARNREAGVISNSVTGSASTQSTVNSDMSARMNPAAEVYTMAGKGRIGSSPWQQALNERVMVMTAQNTQVAEIQLDPPELGSLKVRLQVGQDQVSVSFTSPHASVRDAVEQSMPRLKEMMEEQGLNLGESSVSDQSADEDARQSDQQLASEAGGQSQVNPEDSAVQATEGDAMSLVDYYA